MTAKFIKSLCPCLLGVVLGSAQAQTVSFTEAWKWRKAQQAEGRFEVALQGIEEDEDSIPPDQAMLMEYLNEAYNDYLALAGWEQ